MTFDKVIQFAREEHARHLADLMASENPNDPPLPHIYLWDDEDKLTVFALAIDSHQANAMDFLKNLRLMVQAKILLEGMTAAVYCGIILKSPALPRHLQAIVEQKAKVDPNFLETIAQEHGLVNRESVIVTAEDPSHSFVLEQTYYIRDQKVHLDGEPEETLDRGVPPLPHCRWKWPGASHPRDSRR